MNAAIVHTFRLLLLTLLPTFCTGCLFTNYVNHRLGTTYEELSNPHEVIRTKDGTLIAVVDAHYFKPTLLTKGDSGPAQKRILIGKPTTVFAGLQKAMQVPYPFIATPHPGDKETTYIIDARPPITESHKTGAAPWTIIPEHFDSPDIDEATIQAWKDQALAVYPWDNVWDQLDGRLWHLVIRTESTTQKKGFQRTEVEPWAKDARRKRIVPAMMLDLLISPIMVPIALTHIAG